MINLPDTIFDNSSSGGVWRQLSLPVLPSDWLPGWQACHGISGSFRVEWVAGFPWYQLQTWSGIRSWPLTVSKQ